MSTQQLTHILTQTVDTLSEEKSLKGLFHQHTDGDPLPSGKMLEDIIDLSRAILFPGYYGKSSVNLSTIKYQIGVNVEKLHKLLTEQVLAGLCFGAEDNGLRKDATGRREAAEQIAARDALLVRVRPQRHGRYGSLLRRPRGRELCRDYSLLSRHQGSYQLPYSPRAAPARRTAHSTHHHGDGALGNRYRHPSAGHDR